MFRVRRLCIVLVLIYGGVVGQLIGRRFPFIHNLEPNSQNGSSGHCCKLEQIEIILKKLELKTGEKSERNVHTELEEIRQGNKRLQAVENASVEILRSIKEIQHGNERIQSRENSNGEALEELQKESLRLQDLARASEEVRLALKEISEENGRLQALSSSCQVAHKTLQEIKEQILKLSDPGSLKTLPRSCKEILEKDKNSKSAIYRIQPENSPESFVVRCNMTKRGGGWTYIHNRYDGSQDFYLDIQSYIKGFGNLATEFWLGLEYIYQLTRDGTHELLVELVKEDDVEGYAHYNAFSIGSNFEGYRLKELGEWSGTAGNALTYQLGNKFSTKDHDLDRANYSCAQIHKGAWWYRNCYESNLNGFYFTPGTYNLEGMNWYWFNGFTSLKEARMLIR